MKESTRQMLNEVTEAHDWRRGQVYGGGGTKYSSTDTCRACGLQKHYFSDHQNCIDGEYTFSDADGNPITLRQAAQKGCS